MAATPDWRSFLRRPTTTSTRRSTTRSCVFGRDWPGLRTSPLGRRPCSPSSRRGDPDRQPDQGPVVEARLTWGAMIFGWWGVGVFLNGRCYAPLLAVSTLQCVLFARLLVVPAAVTPGFGRRRRLRDPPPVLRPDRRRRAGPGLPGGAPPGGAATWPAVLAFAPAFGWMAFHAPRLQAFSAAEVAWHALVGPAEAVGFTAFAINPSSPFVLPLAAAVILAGLLPPKASSESDAAPDPLGRLWLVAGAALAGLALTLVSGALRPPSPAATSCRWRRACSWARPRRPPLGPPARRLSRPDRYLPGRGAAARRLHRGAAAGRALRPRGRRPRR